MPNLLNHLAALSCLKIGSQWDRCGVYYVTRVLVTKLPFPAALREDACRHRLSLCASCPAWSGQQDLNLRQPLDFIHARSDIFRSNQPIDF